MSKIFDLIKRLCPQGVEFRELQEICYTITSPIKVKTNEYKEHGNIPIIDQGEKFIAGYCDCDEFINKGEYIVFGDHSEHVKFIDFAFIQGADGLKILVAEHYIMPKFLYYSFINFYQRENNYKRHWSRAKETKLPVPPMEVQREIVRILDCFTLLTAELTAELTARKKQYEFYRDFLLSFDELNKNGGGCELKMLGEVAEIGTGSSNRQDENKNGEYPFYVRSKNILKSDTFEFDETAIIIPGEGGIGDIFHYTEGKYALHQRAYRVHVTYKKLDTKCLYFIMCSYFKKYIFKKSVGATATSIRKPMIEQFLIPIPSIPTQHKIVEILDKFDTLVNSISEGLPREIELRRKQYEYYRDLLLNFKEKSA